MAHSDSDDFHSADEEVVSVINQKKHTKKICAIDENVSQESKVTNIKVEQNDDKKGDGWEDDDWDDFDVNTGTEKTENIDHNLKKCDAKSKNDQWDDFDIDIQPERDVQHEEKKLDKKSNVQTDFNNITVQEKIQNQSNENARVQNDGWDDFGDDWNDDDKDITPKNPATLKEHSENDYKALADKLSSLGDASGNSNTNSSGWGGWGGWGVTSLLTSGVSQITSHVSQGFASVSQAIETGIGIPDPVDLAKNQRNDHEINKNSDKTETEAQSKEFLNVDNKKEPLQSQGSENEDNLNVFKIGKLVSNMTKLVESTGTAVVTGGLDTLEEIGKRTMRVLQGEEDGKKRLSTLLREARDHADRLQNNMTSVEEITIKKNHPQFEALFDDFQGLVHLEALEMLSKQCDIKIQSLLSSVEGKELTELKETLEQVKEICELPEVDEDDHKVEELSAEDFKDKLVRSVEDMGIHLQFDPVVNCWKNVVEIAKELVPSSDNSDEEKLTILEDIMNKAITDLAQISALSIQLLHRSTALLSVQTRRSTADEADGLTQLTAVLMSHISEVANIYTQKLNKQSQECGNMDKVNEFITGVFLEAEKGTSYVQNAFTLTIPILQVGAT